MPGTRGVGGKKDTPKVRFINPEARGLYEWGSHISGYCVGSFDFNFLGSNGFPLDPQKVKFVLQRGQQQRRYIRAHSCRHDALSLGDNLLGHNDNSPDGIMKA